MNTRTFFAITAVLTLALAGTASAREWKIYDNDELGYSLKIPGEFRLRSEGGITTWEFRPPPISRPPIEEERSKAVNLKLGPLNVQFDDPKRRERVLVDQPPIEQPPMNIAVTWQGAPDAPSFSLYKSARASDEQASRAHQIVDIREFDRGQGYDYEGMTYWFRESPDAPPDAVHKWVLRSFGNWASYTVEFTGTRYQFDEWAPVFEEVVRSWRLTPQR